MVEVSRKISNNEGRNIYINKKSTKQNKKKRTKVLV